MFGNTIRETTTTTGTGNITLAGAATGYMTFASQFSAGSVVAYVIRFGSSAIEGGYGTLVNSTTLSRDFVVFSSNSNAPVNFAAGTKDIYCAPNANDFNAVRIGYARSRTSGQRDLGAPVSPAVAQIGTLRATLGNFPLLLAAFEDFEASIDVGILTGHTYHVSASVGGIGLQTINGGSPTVTGTATGRNISDTDLGRRWRTATVSSTSAGQAVGFRTGNFVFNGNGSRGGYCWLYRWANSDAAAVSGARAFYGVRNANANPTDVEPDTQTNTVGFAQLSSANDRTYLIASGTSAQSPIDLGTNFPPIGGAGADAGIAYESVILCTRANVFHYGLRRLDTLQSVAGTVAGSTDATRPGSTLTMNCQGWRSNNATALAVGQDMITMTCWNFII